MRMLLIVAGLALSLVAASQEIWRWVDKDGVVHYSDQPGSPNAELVTVVTPNSYENQPPPAEYERGTTSAGVVTSPYNAVVMVRPDPDQVFFGPDTVVQAVARLDGTLQPDHSLAFFVNGERRPATNGFGIELRNLPRGSYAVRAAVVDQDGVAVISSEQIEFHVRQPSINSPQSPQRPRPPPTAPPPAPPPAN